jgi:hypothetical protein
MFLIILMPLLDVVSVFVAGATQYLATNDFAAKAATQPSYSSALNTVANEAYQFQSNGLAQFVQMVPEGGYTGCGDDLYVLVTDLANGTVTSSAADQPIGQTINTQTNMYEISVKSVYSVAPLVSLAAVPILGDIPGLGKSVTLSFSANRPVEHPGGLQTGSNGNVVGTGGSVTPFNRVASNPASAGPATNITWRTPNIFERIQQAGQTVLNVNVLNVQADYGTTLGGQNGGWITTGITVLPGQMVWLDTQATGSWGDPDAPFTANGGTPPPHDITGDGRIDGSAPYFQLIGWVGQPPILPYGHQNQEITSANFIPAGNTLLNYAITKSGVISLAANDNQQTDVGSQMVRVIITTQ